MCKSDFSLEWRSDVSIAEIESVIRLQLRFLVTYRLIEAIITHESRDEPSKDVGPTPARS